MNPYFHLHQNIFILIQVENFLNLMSYCIIQLIFHNSINHSDNSYSSPSIPSPLVELEHLNDDHTIIHHEVPHETDSIITHEVHHETDSFNLSDHHSQ